MKKLVFLILVGCIQYSYAQESEKFRTYYKDAEIISSGHTQFFGSLFFGATGLNNRYWSPTISGKGGVLLNRKFGFGVIGIGSIAPYFKNTKNTYTQVSMGG